jgi:molybdate transport system ATP-binding protein
MGYLVNPKQDLSVLKLHIQQTVPNPLAIKLEVGDGEIHALVGPSGSGKTSVLRSIAGLHHPEMGHIECANRVWLNRDSARGPRVAQDASLRSCGFLFQQYALFPHLSALENVRIALHNNGESRAEQIQCAHDWLAQLNIAELANRLLTARRTLLCH